MTTMNVEVVSIERPIWSGEGTAVYARTPYGEIGILPGHSPLLAALEPGWIVRVEREGQDDLRVAVHRAFMFVDDGVSILAEMAEEASTIDQARAQRAFERTEDADSDEDADAHVRALTRLRALSADGRDAVGVSV